jgi:hypothetical protein
MEKQFQFVVAVICFILLIIILLASKLVSAENYTNEQIADAIYLAEGGSKAKVPYGIYSVKVNSIEEARRVCLNTIKNNRKRFAKQSKYSDFIEFLGSRYAPIGVKNDPKGLNKYWVRNVKYFLKHHKKGG